MHPKLSSDLGVVKMNTKVLLAKCVINLYNRGSFDGDYYGIQ